MENQPQTGALEHETLTCPQCAKQFSLSPKALGHEGHCSKRCLRDATSLGTRKGSSLPAIVASRAPLTPGESAALRSTLARYAVQQIDRAHKAVMGAEGVEMTSTQARLFSAFLNKVVPDLSQSFVQSESTVTDLRTLSRDQLENLATARLAEMRTVEGTHEDGVLILNTPAPASHAEEAEDATDAEQEPR